MRWIIVLVILSVVITGPLACNGGATANLKQVLNSEGYILTLPATSWPYPGGFLVSNNKLSNFVDLPSTVAKPSALTNQTVDFPALQSTNNFTVSAVLTGLASIIQGNPGLGFGHSSNLTFSEVNANASLISYQQAQTVLANQDISKQVQSWIAQKQTVFVVGVVLTTEKISVSSGSNGNLDLSFNGSSVSQCQNSSNSNSGNTSPSQGGSSNSGNSSSNSSSGGNTPSSNSSNSSQNNSDSSSSNLPGGALHFCMSGSNSVTMNSDTPLVFAVGAYLVQNNNGKLALTPVMQTSGRRGGLLPMTAPESPRYTTPLVKTAAAVRATLNRQPWPTDNH